MAAHPTSSVPDPPDFGRTLPLFTTWPVANLIIRVFNHDYQPNAFNPGKGGGVKGRFHFFTDSAGDVVPALYGSDQEDGAFSETVFHDVPVHGPGRAVRAKRLNSLSIATLAPRRNLNLVELLGYGLGRLGIQQQQLTTTPVRDYPSTIRWAQSLHAAFPDIDGLVWMSRQFNAARSVVLFGDRVRSVDMDVAAPPLPLAIGPGFDRVAAAANIAGIAII
jgi:hypothetical protein